MHASAFLIRETKSGRRVARFFLFGIFMGACNQGGKVLEFLWWGRHRRHSFGFLKRQKWKILIFHFWCYQGFRGEAPNASIEFYSMAKCALRESVLGSFRRNA